MASADTVPIPQPPGLPFLGNVADIDPEFPIGFLMRSLDQYGPLIRWTIGQSSRLAIGNQAMMNEVCDEKRFSKVVAGPLEEVRNGVRDGLFTAYNEERDWGIAHRVLMPAFGPLSIRSMFDEMHDIASQLVLKWARYGSKTAIHVTDDFTRLTLDTLALCAMDFRFNSYYQDVLHPFVDAMGSFLIESGRRASRPGIATAFYRGAQAKYDADIKLLQDTAQEVIDNRRANPTEKQDLLNSMLYGRDPKTGEGLSDDAIRNNMITFLIAGHETTSGLLSFTFYRLLKNPQAYLKAQQEVDTVIGQARVTVDHLSKLPYINAVLRESLRLNPTAPIIQMGAIKDEVLGGKYHVPKGEPIFCVLDNIHRDPVVWGEDAEAFIPERMLDENFERITKEFPNCWRPFGNGMRGCIGRPFAWQEALLVVSMLLQNFNFSMEDPSYNLRVKQTLTVKPEGFKFRAALRDERSATKVEDQLFTANGNGDTAHAHPAGRPQAPVKKGFPLSVYYGSNTGTCEALARRLSSNAGAHGFQATVVDALDTAKERLPTDHPVVIITSSYEGQPPDNAGNFMAWLESLKGDKMKSVSYAAFGCGHPDWATTFHRIPKLVDKQLAERGATRIAPLGLADAAAGDIFNDFERWEDEVFWPAMKEKHSTADDDLGPINKFEIEVSTPRPAILRQDVKKAYVVEAKTLSAPGVPEKKHLTVALPSDTTYSVGDYLAILPLNPKENISRAMRCFCLAWDSTITINSDVAINLPTNMPISAVDIFGAYVELAQPASKRNISTLLTAAAEEATKTELTRLLGDAFTSDISAKRVSVLDLLEKFPDIALPLSAFLQMLPPMRVRQYSISSSPLWNPSQATLTYAVLDQPSLAAGPARRHVGVATSHLSSLAAGDTLYVSVRPTGKAFRPPTQPEATPIIMVAAGSGLAPFRGFVQERAMQIEAGRKLAPALLFFGCRGPSTDDLYREQFDEWEALGAVSVLRAYSRAPNAVESKGANYIQDRLYMEKERVVELYDKGAKVFVCGNAAVGQAVKDTLCQIAVEKAKEKGEDTDETTVKKWFEGIKNDRFITDVFA